MHSRRGAHGTAATAQAAVLDELKADHKRMKKAYRAFQKLDAIEDPQAVHAIVLQLLDELTVHAALEEEMLYPAAHDALDDETLVDEAEVEHETLHMLIDQLQGMAPDDEKYAARFTVLCEYVLHHVKDEEGRLFPALAAAPLDWVALAAEMAERRRDLVPGIGAPLATSAPKPHALPHTSHAPQARHTPPAAPPASLAPDTTLATHHRTHHA